MAPEIPDTLITTYLEMSSIDEFCPRFLTAEEWRRQEASIQSLTEFDAPFYRFLYREVGERWLWFMRRDLSDEEMLQKHLAENCLLDVLYVRGRPAGYIELAMGDEEARSERAVEVAYFGLRAPFMGRGLGKHLLSHGVQAAWDGGAKRIWLHTCNLDAPQALPNYLRCGFRIARVEEEPMPALYRD